MNYVTLTQVALLAARSSKILKNISQKIAYITNPFFRAIKVVIIRL